MFDSKKKQLFTQKEKQVKTTSESTPPFVQAGMKKKAQVSSGNGAVKYSTTGNPFVDQFGKVGEYKKPRPFSEIEKDCEELWAVDKLDAVKMAFYIRMITRTTDYVDPIGKPGIKLSLTQRGAEMKNEGIMRIIWLATKNRNAFIVNLPLVPVCGSWKDIITMLQIDLAYNGWGKRVLPWDAIGSFISAALREESQSELLKKYLPHIQASAKCTTVEAQADTLIGKWLCSLLFGKRDEDDYSNYIKYRKLKSTGTAHEWQQLISRGQFQKIDFAKIHGRALSLLVRSKFLKRQKLQDKYEAWIKKDTTKDVKFTGFVHELFQDMFAGRPVKYNTLSSVPEHIRVTTNKQFETLVNKGKGTGVETSSLIVVRDTSGSMGSDAVGTKMSCNGIGRALALYFSEFLQGKFSNSWIEFNSDAKMHTWKGKTPIEKWFNDGAGYTGNNTNFQSVIRLFCQIKSSGVPESEFPSGILCISDGEFDSSSLSQTNVETARVTLRSAGFSKEYSENFVICLWNLQNRYYGAGSGSKFETFGGAKNVYYFSGYSASVVAFLTGKVETAAELVETALSQEILNLIRI